MTEQETDSALRPADLVYETPPQAAVEGLPIGNGTMGSLVWTTPDAVHLQINRSDVFAVDQSHVGPAAPPLQDQEEHVDYCGGCARVSLQLGGEVLAGAGARQELSLHEAEVQLRGQDVVVRAFVSARCDVLILEVEDTRARPEPLELVVSTWRPAEVRTGNHLARHTWTRTPGQVLLQQEFSAGEYHCRYAVAAGVVGKAQVVASSGQSQSLRLPVQAGRTTVVVASAASWSRQADVGKEACRLLAEASAQGWASLRAAHAEWWRAFWARTIVRIASADGVGEFVERVRQLHLYYLAATSRGALPPKWNGALFTTEGDRRAWGSQYWVWTTEMPYWPLYAADAVDLTEPYWRMYLGQLPACRAAARQRWGVEGAFYPETTTFGGPVVLPEDVALEVRQVLAGDKPQSELTGRARALCQFESHLSTLLQARHPGPAGRYSYISHVVSSGCELAVQAWWRYRYTGDLPWLHAAYPLLRDTVEFYRHFVRPGDDGWLHVHGTNAHEDFWGVTDSIMDLAAIRGVAPLAIRTARILGLDPELAARWQEMLDRLAPYPRGTEPEARALTGGVLGDEVWAAGHLADVDGQHNPEDVWLNPVFPFEDWTLETSDPEMDAIVHQVVDLAPRHASVLAGARLTTAIRSPIAAARAGRGEALPAVLAAYYAAFAPLANGLSLFEGEQAHSVEHLGLITMTLQESLLQSLAPRPGQAEVIRVFPAWPSTWDADFRLLARGGFLVTSAVRAGQVQYVELESRLGEECRLRNPWAGSCTLTEAGGTTQELAGSILCFATQPGHRYRLCPVGRGELTEVPRLPAVAEGPVRLALRLPNGNEAQGTLGRSR